MYAENEIIMYLRKSRADRPDETVEEVLEKHEAILQDYALTTYGYKIPEGRIFREVVSGETIAARPEMQKVMSKIEGADVKGVLIVDPQRLSRGDLEDCGRIVNAFRYTKTKVITPYKEYDLEEKFDRKFFEMELTRGNDYLEYTKEILSRGRLASVKKGNFIGSIAPFGYKKIVVGKKEHTLEIVPDEADALRLMYDLYLNKNYGFTNIAHTLDNLGVKPRKAEHWSPAAIKDILENPVYIGKIRWNWRKSVKVIEDGEFKVTRPKTKDESSWIYVDGKHPAIIDNDTFQAALDKRGKNVRVKSKVKMRNPFSGLVFCECGRAMTYRTYYKNGIERSPARLLCDNQVHCKNKSVLYSEFEEFIIHILEESITDFECKMKSGEDTSAKVHENMIVNLEKELARLNRKDEEQHDLLEEGFYTKELFIKRNSKLQEERKEVIKALWTAKESQPKKVDYSERISCFRDAVESLKDNNVDAAAKNIWLKKCISKITYSRHTDNRSRWDNTPFTIDMQLLI